MKIMLLTDIPPCTNYTAGLVLDQFCSFLPEGALGCFSVLLPAHSPEIPERWKSIPYKEQERPREHWGVSKPERLVSFMKDALFAKGRIASIAEEAIRFGKALGADLLWCVLEGQTLIRLALPVAKGLDIPLYTQVWDPPGWWIREHRIDFVTAGRVLRHYGEALRHSACIGAASWAMAEAYGREYHTRAVSVVPGLDADSAQQPAAAIHPGDELVIGVAGQLYASAEWSSLVSTLDGVHWRIGGRKVRIRLLGRDFIMHTSKETRIEYLGWHSQKETVKLLSETDILYCPYWFDPAFETEARLCFPSKLIAYLAAGRPVVFHGPEYASPARFVREHDAAILCHSLDPAEVTAALNSAIADDSRYGELARNGRLAFDEHLTLSAARRSFLDFLSGGR